MNKEGYHYCSVETFHAIISNKSLRLCDINKTNDYAEKKWSMNLIIQVVGEIINQWKDELQTVHNIDFSIKVEKDVIQSKIVQVVNTDIPMLIVCFSTRKDILSQWRAYGDDGKGVSIGFDLDMLSNLYEVESGSDKNINVPLIEMGKVIYNKKKQKQKIEERILSVSQRHKTIYENKRIYDKNMLKKFNNNMEAISKFMFLYKLITKTDEIIDIILPECCFLKNPEFKEEHEYRILYYPINPLKGKAKDENFKDAFENSNKAADFELDKVKYLYKNKSNEIVAYSDIRFHNYIRDGIIKKVTLGPKCKLKKNDVRYFLMSHGYDVDKIVIDRSKATYR